MTMNLVHRLCCSSNYWARTVEQKLLPWALRDVDLGDNTLEIGPGYGANLWALIGKTASLTAVEIDGSLAHRLHRRYGDRARLVHGRARRAALAGRQALAIDTVTPSPMSMPCFGWPNSKLVARISRAIRSRCVRAQS